MKTKIIQNIKSIILALILVIGVSYVSAYSTWVAPTATAPGNNTDTPINVGSSSQIKAGNLWIKSTGLANGLIVENGNVGIGITSPSQKLDVNGYVKGTGMCIGTSCITAWPTGGSTGVSQIMAGTNVTISPTGGTGVVTINATSSALALSCQRITATGNGTSATATCPSGYLLTGGGVSGPAISGNIYNYPNTSNGWFCSFINGEGVITCYAVCCKVQ